MGRYVADESLARREALGVLIKSGAFQRDPQLLDQCFQQVDLLGCPFVGLIALIGLIGFVGVDDADLLVADRDGDGQRRLALGLTWDVAGLLDGLDALCIAIITNVRLTPECLDPGFPAHFAVSLSYRPQAFLCLLEEPGVADRHRDLVSQRL